MSFCHRDDDALRLFHLIFCWFQRVVCVMFAVLRLVLSKWWQLVVSPLKVFTVKCGWFCHDVSASWRRFAAFFHPVLWNFVTTLVDLIVWCSLCLMFSSMLGASIVNRFIVFDSFQGELCAILSPRWRRFAAFSSHFVAILVDIYVLRASCLVF